MKVVLIVIFLTLKLCVCAQSKKTERVVKTCKVYANKKMVFYYENDINGNKIFTKNDGMNGPITLLYVSEYDSLKREVRNYSAHSNIGFSIIEKVYDANKISYYEYQSDSLNEISYHRDTLNEINSQKEFLELKSIKQLRNGIKQLKEVEVLDSNSNVIAEIYFSFKGDTSSINTRKYDSMNKELLFRYGIKDEEPWSWDIYSVYDNNSNLIKSIRVSLINGIMDTSEVCTYQYNSLNKLSSVSYHTKKKFGNRAEYIYDKNNKVIEERFYEGEEFILDVKTNYKYKKNGVLLRKVQRDFRENEKVEKVVFRNNLSYW